MIKNITDEVWAFDCEWVPDMKAGRLIYGLPDDCPDDEVLKQMWAMGGATQENPQPFLKTIYCKVVSIAVVIRRRLRDGSVQLFLSTLPEKPDDPAQDERYVLKRFLNDGLAQRSPQLVGYNSRNADLRILVQRAFVQGLSEPELCRRLDAKPWESPDVDLMDCVAGFGRSYSATLNDVARLSGVPGKLDMDGYKVCETWYKGNRRQVVEYNSFDALTTYLVWLRLAMFSGVFTQEQYAVEQGRVRQLLEAEIKGGKDYLATFVEAWDDLQKRKTQ